MFIYKYIYIHIYLIYIERVNETVRKRKRENIFALVFVPGLFCVIAFSIEGIVQVDQRQLQFKSVNTMRFWSSYTIHGTVKHVAMRAAVVVVA